MNLTERYSEWRYWDEFDYGCSPMQEMFRWHWMWLLYDNLPKRFIYNWMFITRWPRFVYWQIAWEVPRLICKIRGHNYEDCSSIGPDSGTEAYECSRCGHSWSHTYY